MGRSSNRKILNSFYDLNDATILLVFLVVIVSIIFFYGESHAQKPSQQPGDPQMLLSKLVINDRGEASPVALIVGNSVDSTALGRISNTAYDQLKLSLGIQSEFVIYFEDQSGNLVTLGNRPCIGSSFALVSGHKCSE